LVDTAGELFVARMTMDETEYLYSSKPGLFDKPFPK
jgi:hypothetical protein